MNSLYTAEGVMDKHSLWQRYVPLVRHEALRLQVRLPASVELDDLLQAGGIGLLNAVERYDALQGTAFTTYAVQRIRGAMLDELRSRDWVPRSVRRNAREMAQAIGQLEQELGRNATETEVTVDGENRRLTGGGRVFAGVPGIGCSGGKSGSAAKSGGGAGNLHRIYGFIAWRDWTTGWAGDELGGRTCDLSGGGGTGRNRVITDVAIKKTASGTRP